MENLKQNKLTLQEYIEFINNVVAECINFEDNTILWHLKNIAIKKNFALFYLGLDWDSEKLEESYDKIHNLNFAQYEQDISLIQFHDILESINKVLEQKDEEFKQYKRPSIDNLISSVTNYLDSMSAQFESIDVKEFVEVAQNLNNQFTGIDDNQVIKTILDTVTNSSKKS